MKSAMMFLVFVLLLMFTLAPVQGRSDLTRDDYKGSTPYRFSK
jgi:hypothetical protein